ncbi:PEPxxWA-CTERM sorting domain-containing protein [Phenylobacterium sp.]|uniref:PEPxxWA-CTERM sorting domain-containing protein n=1 Tax=Phenylobacterium sp. TaxID=1871053 RepID=UPI0025FBF636|nr:PEPxxWA-CTERM sorting domain-containing protein [Phenylobacterium sp.]
MLVRHKFGAIAPVVALVVGALSASPADAALFIVGTTADSGTIQTPGPGDPKNIRSDAPAQTSSYSATDRAFDQSARASSSSSAQAQVGAVHAFSTGSAEAFAPGCCTSASGTSSAYAEYNDTFLLRSNAFADGTVATITADILVNGSAGGVYSGDFWSGSVFWRATTALNGQSYVDAYSSQGNATNGFITSGSAFGLRTVTFDVVFGQAANVILRVETIASASAGGFGPNSAVFTSDLGHTVSWQGISKLVVAGQEITDYTAVSPDTGFDFVRGFEAQAAVPEPASWALMILGFGLMGHTVRARRQRPASAS